MDSFAKKMFRQAMGYFNHISEIDEESIKELEALVSKLKAPKKETKDGDKIK